MEDGQRGVRVFVNPDPDFDVVGPFGSGYDREDRPAVTYGVVASDSMLCVETVDVVELVGPGERHEGGAIVEFGRDCEAPVVVGQIGLEDEPVGGWPQS